MIDLESKGIIVGNTIDLKNYRFDGENKSRIQMVNEMLAFYKSIKNYMDIHPEITGINLYDTEHVNIIIAEFSESQNIQNIK